MRIWFKEWKDNHLIKDTVVEDFGEETRTHKVFMALEEACRRLDLAVPIWLDPAVRQDAFIEKIDFDYLEIQVIEED